MDPLQTDPSHFVYAQLIRLERHLDQLREDLSAHVSQERTWQVETTERLTHALREVEAFARVRVDVERLKGWKMWVHGFFWPIAAAAAYFHDQLRGFFRGSP